ncbi:MAG: DNA polymerase III subunit gamma/tau [bacterium]|nr:DNA polymerase III subunit gamma/tau [bacterium]
MTYYLKYRPQSLKDLDLDFVRESLQKTILSGNIPHAYLFSGPKGTGKTSAARIMAKIINCEQSKSKKKYTEPCNKCDQCKSITKGTNIDVIEIDAASHRGIDDIRSLRDAVKLSPAQAKKKVYIIDEAHMLTTEACNALLKTLEEPPDHVVFVLATTNPEKLIETIRSRTTEIFFTKPDIPEIIRSLKKVVTGEKIKIEKEALAFIAQASKGSFRDAVKILEQLVSEKVSLKADNVDAFLFKSRSSGVDLFLAILGEKDTKKAIIEIEKTVVSGGAVKDYIEMVLERIRSALLATVGVGNESLDGFGKDDLIGLSELLFKALEDTSVSSIEQLPLEIAIVKWCSTNKDEETKVPALKNRLKVNSNIDDDKWKDILTKIRPINTSIEALLRAAKPLCFDGKVLTLSVYYRFHKECLEEIHHRKVLEDVIGVVMGNPVKVVCTLAENKQTVPNLTPPDGVLTEPDSVLTKGEDKDILKIAEEIFGN